MPETNGASTAPREFTGTPVDEAIRTVLFAITSLEEAARLADDARRVTESVAAATRDGKARARLEENALAFAARAKRARSTAATARKRLQRLGVARRSDGVCVRSIVWDIPEE